MIFSIPDIIFLFFTYSFVGWLWETIYCSLRNGHFSYRGFLVGPYCPVYGFAVTTVLFFTEPFQANLIALFFSGIVVATLFEYFAAWFLETFFHMQLWDYSSEWGNIKGRVAPRISLFWGFGIIILVRFIQPLVMNVISHVNDWFALGIAVLMTADFIWTVIDTAQFQQAALAFEQRIRSEQEKLQELIGFDLSALSERAESFSQGAQEWKEKLEIFFNERGLQPLRFNQRRLLRNYKVRIVQAPIVSTIRQQIADFRKKY